MHACACVQTDHGDGDGVLSDTRGGGGTDSSTTDKMQVVQQITVIQQTARASERAILRIGREVGRAWRSEETFFRIIKKWDGMSGLFINRDGMQIYMR